MITVVVFVVGQVRVRAYIGVLDGLEISGEVISLEDFSEQYVVGGSPPEMLSAVDAIHLEDGRRVPVPDDIEALSRCLSANLIGKEICLVIGNREWGRATGSNMVVITRFIETGGFLEAAASSSSRLVELGPAVGSESNTIAVAVGPGILHAKVEGEVDLQSCESFQDPQSDELRDLAGFSLPDAEKFRVYVSLDDPSVVFAIGCSHL